MSESVLVPRPAPPLPIALTEQLVRAQLLAGQTTHYKRHPGPNVQSAASPRSASFTASHISSSESRSLEFSRSAQRLDFAAPAAAAHLSSPHHLSRKHVDSDSHRTLPALLRLEHAVSLSSL